jgi:hypothetical protein
MSIMENEYFEVKLKVEVDMAKKAATIVESEVVLVKDPKSKGTKILEYLEEQLAITEEEMKASSSNAFDNDLKVDRMVSQRMYYRLKGIVKAANKL